jgi:hypothetical protein
MIPDVNDAALMRLMTQDEIGSWFGSVAPTVGQKVMAASIPVTFALDQTALSVTFAAPNSTGGLAMGKSIPSGSGTDAYIPLYATVYNEPTSEAQRSVSSTVAADAAAGTGARTVRITYQNSALTGPFTEIVTLNGTTTVNTVATNIRFIEKIEVVTAGTSSRNAGVITLFGSTGGGGGTVTSIGTQNLFVDTIGSPAVNGDNRTLLAHHYVPSTKTATFSTVTGGTTGNQNGLMFLVCKNPTVTNDPETVVGDLLTVGLNATGLVRELAIPITIEGPAKLTLIVVPAGNGTSFYGSFDFSEVNT